jgi:hypothetical protein
MPAFEFETRNVRCTTNPLGVKGAGEAGTIGATPAVMNAVVDALHRAHGITHLDMPATPERVWQAIRAAKPGQAHHGETSARKVKSKMGSGGARRTQSKTGAGGAKKANGVRKKKSGKRK